MLDHGIAVAKLFFAVTLNAIGLLAWLAAAWFMPQLLQLVVGSGGPSG